MSPRRRSNADRFAEKMAPTESPGGCHLWAAGVDREGYGVFWMRDPETDRLRLVRAHRFAWEQANGPLPPGTLLRHGCDTPPCCRVDHLRPGSHRDNMADRDARGRTRRGERHPLVILSDEQVEALRRDSAAGVTQRALATQYGIGKSQVHRIVAGQQRARPS